MCQVRCKVFVPFFGEINKPKHCFGKKSVLADNSKSSVNVCREDLKINDMDLISVCAYDVYQILRL